MLYDELLEEFKQKVYELQQQNKDYLEQAKLGIVICQQTLSLFKDAVMDNGFRTKREEIHFFRDVKMEPLRYLVFYQNVRDFEQRMPQVGKVPKTDFFNHERDRVNAFFDIHINFQIYMEQGLGHSDKRYFLRKHLNDFPSVFAEDYFRDPLFNTAFDKLWAVIKGYGLYGRYLDDRKKELDIENGIHIRGIHSRPPKKLELTLKRPRVVELMYALILVGGVNNGNVTIKEVAEYIKEHHGIDLGDYSHTFHRFRERINPTLFLDQMREKLIAYMNKLDG